VLPGHPVGVLTGPNLAREIMDGQAAASVIGMADLVVAEALQPVFASGLFRVYTNHDVVGCEIGGALKNVVAIATGMAESLTVGDNTRAMVITRGLAEITRLGVAMGGEPATFAGLAGLGDLLAKVTAREPAKRDVPVEALIEALDEIATGELPVAPEETPVPAPLTGSGERRHLTVMFCDLCGSTALSVAVRIKRKVVPLPSWLSHSMRALLRSA